MRAGEPRRPSFWRLYTITASGFSASTVPVAKHAAAGTSGAKLGAQFCSVSELAIEQQVEPLRMRQGGAFAGCFDLDEGLGHAVEAKLVEQVKSSSSAWIKTQHPWYTDFAWQAGYGEFSVSPRVASRDRIALGSSRSRKSV